MTEPANEIIYMDAVLTPNASLSPHAFRLVMGLAIAMSLVSSLMFTPMGAWPVMGFFALDLFAIWFAFRWVRRRARQETRVRVTANRILMHHRDGEGREKRAEIPSAFARVELDEPVRPTSWLRIEHGRTAYIIGRFLTPKERKTLAEGLRNALQRARSERHSA
ncbi:MAG: DUF2244 domain-containing protein [Hyphomonadaceae bacterium]|nr:DUF2244 domain-containing protein [Hyphomonadaceae bacterium]